MDRNKVIKGLECCRSGCKFGCPYADEESSTCESVLAADALELLKEQEYEPVIKTIVPNNISNGFGWSTCTTNWYACGACGKEIDTNDKFCRHCGRGVRWDDSD